MAELIVSAPMVMATTKSGFTRHFYRGDVLPDDVSKESVKHLKHRGMLAGKDEFVEQSDDGEPDQADSDDEDTDDGDAPAGNASLEDWQAYARSQGASEEDVEGKSRNDLREEFGK